MAEFKTRDVSLAAFIRLKGYDLLKYQIVTSENNRKEGEWIFDISHEEAQLVKVAYVNSEIATFEGIRRGMSKQKYG
jgi:hypothetical protein